MDLSLRPRRVLIARLVLRGVPPKERDAFAVSLRAEIARELGGPPGTPSEMKVLGVRQAAEATVRAVRQAVDPGDGHG